MARVGKVAKQRIATVNIVETDAAAKERALQAHKARIVQLEQSLASVVWERDEINAEADELYEDRVNAEADSKRHKILAYLFAAAWAISTGFHIARLT